MTVLNATDGFRKQSSGLGNEFSWWGYARDLFPTFVLWLMIINSYVNGFFLGISSI